MNNQLRQKLALLSGVIFDLDGILVDTEYFQWQGWVEVLKPLNISLSKETYFKYAGKQGDAIESELIKDFHLNIKKNELLSKKEKLLIDWFHSKQLQVMPFVKEAVSYLQGKGYKLACGSGGPREEVILKLKKTNLLPFFHTVISGSDVTRGKPFPDIYTQAVALLNLSPKECFAFEDTQYGVAAAKSAGLVCFAIPSEFSREQDFSKADGIFDSLKEAVEWLKN